MCYIKIGKIVIAILYGDNILMYDWNINNNINVEALPKPIGLPVFYIHGGDTNEKYKVYINHGGFVTPCDNIPKTSIYSYNAIFVYSTLE